MQPRHNFFYWLERIAKAEERQAVAAETTDVTLEKMNVTLEAIDLTLKALFPPEPAPTPVEFIIGPVREQS